MQILFIFVFKSNVFRNVRKKNSRVSSLRPNRREDIRIYAGPTRDTTLKMCKFRSRRETFERRNRMTRCSSVQRLILVVNTYRTVPFAVI